MMPSMSSVRGCVTTARAILTVALAAGLLRTPAVHACARCGCGDPTLTAAGTEQPFQNRVRVSGAVQFRTDTVGADASEMRLAEQRLDAQVAWAPLPRLFFMAGVPLLWRDIQYSDASHRASGGLG